MKKEYTKLLEKHLKEEQRKHSLAYLVLEKHDLEREYFKAIDKGKVEYSG